jgi:hypothetical protein
MGAVVEAWHLSDVGIELLYTTYKLTYIDALGLLKYVNDIVLFLLCRVDGEHGEQVKHDAVIEQLVKHSPWAFQGDACRFTNRLLSVCSLTILFHAYLLSGESKF